MVGPIALRPIAQALINAKENDARIAIDRTERVVFHGFPKILYRWKTLRISKQCNPRLARSIQRPSQYQRLKRTRNGPTCKLRAVQQTDLE